jgi:hypothetical protein
VAKKNTFRKSVAKKLWQKKFGKKIMAKKKLKNI